MELALYCFDKSREALQGIIESKGIFINNSANIAVVEKGIEMPANAIAIVFEFKNLNYLIGLLDMFAQKSEISKNIIIGKKGDKYEIVSFDKVMYFEAYGNEVFFYANKEKFLIRSKLYELEESLSEKGFVRINKSVILNILALKEVIPWFDSRFILKLQDDVQLEVSKTYFKNFKDFIGL